MTAMPFSTSRTCRSTTPRATARCARSTARAFDVPEGRIVGLVGESGCGKTTAVRAIMGVLAENGRRAGGQVALQGQGDRRETTTRPLLWREIAYVPQSAMSSLDPVYTVGAQIAEVLVKRGGASRAPRPRRARPSCSSWSA